MRLAPTGHRPWPLPAVPPVMQMIWHELLFMHWPVSAEQVQRLLPSGLRVDTFEGEAWIGVIPFRMSGIRARGCPPLAGLSAFPELNVRTYTTVGGKPGVYFLSLDAAHRLAVRAARRWFHLRYLDAKISTERRGDTIDYHSKRTHRGEPAAELKVRYRPTGGPSGAAPGTLEHFLIERYCLYAVDRGGGVHRGEIHHEPWPICPADAEIASNSMTEAYGIGLQGRRPHLMYAGRMVVPAWWPAKVGGDEVKP